MKRANVRWTDLVTILVVFVVAASPILAAETVETTALETAEEAVEQGSGVEQILMAFAHDFEQDPFAGEPLTFAVQVTDSEMPDWTIAVNPVEEAGRVADVRVTAGMPSEPAPVFVTNLETLSRLQSGSMHGLTAAAKAKSSDYAPLDLDAMEGFEVSQEVVSRLIPLYFHFWTRGNPEVIPWGREELTRVVHGASAGIFYYQPGFRSGWFHMTRGQHANEDESEQVNPFPTLIIGVSGTARSLIGGKPVTIHGGEAVLIPAGVSHEFWNDDDEPAVGILLMFGEGA